MKKRSVSGSPYWALSTMLQSCEAMQLATAATMPRRSPQDSVSTKRAASAVMPSSPETPDIAARDLARTDAAPQPGTADDFRLG